MGCGIPLCLSFLTWTSFLILMAMAMAMGLGVEIQKGGKMVTVSSDTLRGIDFVLLACELAFFLAFFSLF